MHAAENLAEHVSIASACKAMRVSRTSLYRRRKMSQSRHGNTQRHPRAHECCRTPSCAGDVDLGVTRELCPCGGPCHAHQSHHSTRRRHPPAPDGIWYWSVTRGPGGPLSIGHYKTCAPKKKTNQVFLDDMSG